MTRPKLLVVDDDELMVRSSVRLLRGFGDVTAVASGQEALALLRRGVPFDVIISDLVMPEMTGVQLYQRVNLEFPAMREKVIFLSGSPGSRYMEGLEAIDGALVLPKPCPFDELREAIGQRTKPIR